MDCTQGAARGCVQQAVVDGPGAVADTTGRGTAAVNEAMQGASATADSSIGPGSAPASGSSASPEGVTAKGAETGVPGNITQLPETGGVPPTVLGSGVVLVALGLTARKVVGR